MLFYAVANHPRLYGVQASWHYFEAGHGKGACDGIGGVVKRTADTALKSGKVNITNGKDFYEWGLKLDSKIKYEFIERTEYEEAKEKNDVRQKHLNKVKGTLEVHAVVGVNEHEVMVRDTTCACSNCLTDKGFIWPENNVCGWRKEILSKTEEDYQNKAAENVAFENEDFVPANTQHPDRENECDTVEEEITKMKGYLK
jgi:hypothetical protein